MQSTWISHQPFGILLKGLLVFFFLAVVLLAGANIWYKQSLAAPTSVEEKKVFVIPKGESAVGFIQRLKEENLIKSELAFRIFLFFSGLDKEIQAGSYHLATNLTGREVVEVLTRGRFDKWSTFVEGLRKEEVATILEENFGIEQEQFLKKAKEGYLFPDTYLIPEGASVDAILEIFQKNFDKKITKDMIEKATKNGLSKQEMIVLASIVERETRGESERPIVAGILLKRWREGILIAADATLQYALGFSRQEKTWWRKDLTVDDIEVDSPYNTRKKAGLPPGAICSPGLSSIEAVANPKDSPYYYYIHDKDGKIHYAKTLEDHQQNISNYITN